MVCTKLSKERYSKWIANFSLPPESNYGVDTAIEIIATDYDSAYEAVKAAYPDYAPFFKEFRKSYLNSETLIVI